MKKIISILFILMFLFSCESKENKKNNKETIRRAKLVFTGDIMTHPKVVEAFEGNDILIDLKDYFQGDIVFANLEFVVNTNKPPWSYA